MASAQVSSESYLGVRAVAAIGKKRQKKARKSKHTPAEKRFRRLMLNDAWTEWSCFCPEVCHDIPRTTPQSNP